MKTLLINSNRFKQPWPVIPFGLGCVAAAVEQAGHRVKVLDLCFSGNPRRDIRRMLKEFEPDVIGISIRNIDNGAGHKTEFLLEDVRRDVVAPCKESFAGPIIIGGPSVGVNGAEMLDYLDLQYAIRGDGEATMPEFLCRLESGRPLQRMGGLVRRVDGRIVEDNAPMFVCDLDQLPMDRVYDHIDLTMYSRFGSQIQVQVPTKTADMWVYRGMNDLRKRLAASGVLAGSTSVLEALSMTPVDRAPESLVAAIPKLLSQIAEVAGGTILPPAATVQSKAIGWIIAAAASLLLITGGALVMNWSMPPGDES
jgi:hypothetical protein